MNQTAGRIGLLNQLYGFYAWVIGETSGNDPDICVLENAKSQLWAAIQKKIQESDDELEKEKRKKFAPPDPETFYLP
jgi:hypothetical protein